MLAHNWQGPCCLKGWCSPHTLVSCEQLWARWLSWSIPKPHPDICKFTRQLYSCCWIAKMSAKNMHSCYHHHKNKHRLRMLLQICMHATLNFPKHHQNSSNQTIYHSNIHLCCMAYYSQQADIDGMRHTLLPHHSWKHGMHMPTCTFTIHFACAAHSESVATVELVTAQVPWICATFLLGWNQLTASVVPHNPNLKRPASASATAIFVQRCQKGNKACCTASGLHLW